MKRIINNIVIEYESEAENFINEIIDYLVSEMNKIYSFFGFIPQEPIKIKIEKSLEELRKTYENNVSEEPMPEWVVGFSTLDHVAHLLSYNEYKNTPHKHETLENYKKTLAHEFIHAVHDLFCGGKYEGPRSIWEGLAVYLSGQVIEDGELSVNKEELLNHCDMKEYYYFFKKILETYDHQTILKILKNEIDGNLITDEIYARNKGLK